MLRDRVVRASLLALALAGGACDERPARGGGPPAPAVRRYTLRAEVTGLPDPKDAGRHLALRHEAIHDFEDASGKVVGMDSMVMPFEVAAGVPLDGIAVGDPVEVVFAVDWAAPSLRIERVRELPAGTSLTFGPARPAAPAAR